MPRQLVRKVIAGPGVYICDRCIWLATDAAARRVDQANDLVEIRYVTGAVEAKYQAKCSFCGERRSQVGAMLAADDARICDECLDLCHEILAEEGVSRR